jgi:uncharacterized protein YidB (DUF937 family)
MAMATAEEIAMSVFDELKKQLGSLLGGQTEGEAPAEGGTVASGDAMGSVVEMLEKQGLGPVMQKLQDKGLGDVVSSWISKGENLPISPQQLQHGLGPETIEKLAEQIGVPPGQASSFLAQYLPLIVDRLTPHGTIEDEPGAPAAP